jgi:hypothetical protein
MDTAAPAQKPSNMPLRRTQPNTVHRDFGSIRLWRDDLAEIVSIMREGTPSLSLQADAYSLDDIDDLTDLEGNRITAFRAASPEERILLNLGADSAFISADDPDLPTRTLLEEVYRIATRRRRWLPPKYPVRIISATICVAGLAVLGLSSGILDHAPSWIFWAAAISSLVALPAGLMAELIGDSRPKAIISSSTHAEEPPWLERNRDALVTNAIVSLVFLLIGFVVGAVADNC